MTSGIYLNLLARVLNNRRWSKIYILKSSEKKNFEKLFEKVPPEEPFGETVCSGF